MKIKKSILVETIKKALKEAEFDASKFPFPKADTDGKYAKYVAQAGKPEFDTADSDDRVASNSEFSTTAEKLSPSQREIKLGQALGMAVSMIGKLPGPFKNGPGGNLGAVISKDNYIMDGHHRWAASIFSEGPGIELGGTKIEMDGEELVKVLALMGDAFHPGERKKPSPHNIMNATADDVNNFINKFVQEGIGEFVDAETVKKVLEKRFGSIEKAKIHFVSQLESIKKEPPTWAESRDKMPVLEPDQQEPEKVAKAMAAGQVDVYRPYADAPGEKEQAPGNRAETKKLKINKENLTRMVRESLRKMTSSINEKYYHISDATYEDGTLAEDVEFWDDVIEEAEYQGRKVELNKPMQGDVKKSKVYVKNKKGNVVKVNFGDPDMKIRKSNPEARKNFRARHNCADKMKKGDKTKAGYWSCKAW